jgi:hypothetical protein
LQRIAAIVADDEVRHGSLRCGSIDLAGENSRKRICPRGPHGAENGPLFNAEIESSFIPVCPCRHPCAGRSTRRRKPNGLQYVGINTCARGNNPAAVSQ